MMGAMFSVVRIHSHHTIVRVVEDVNKHEPLQRAFAAASIPSSRYCGLRNYSGVLVLVYSL